MAEVREAVDLRLDRRVAVKLLAGGAADHALRARFLREATAAAQFTHPHAVMVYDTGEDNGTLYLVMELVDGPSLARVLANRGPLDPADAVTIADQVLAAVAAGHRAGLVHRDIKPSNILFTSERVAKLADFGIAKGIGHLAANLTATGQVIGTPRYLSPEQAAGQEATPASDLYAVGVVLFEMLSGTPPFSGDTAFATALAHRQAPVPALVDRCPGLDPDLAAVVERSLAKSPERRYPDAAAMRAALASPRSAVRAYDAEVTETAVVPTRPLDVPPAPSAGNRPAWQRRGAIVGSLALLAAIGAAVALVARVDGGDGDPAAAQSLEATTTTTTTIPTTTTTAPPTTPPAPPTIGALTDILMGDAEELGEKGVDLLDKLQEIQRESPEKRVEEARDLIEDILEWAEEGEIDAEIAPLAISVLESFS